MQYGCLRSHRHQALWQPHSFAVPAQAAPTINRTHGQRDSSSPAAHEQQQQQQPANGMSSGSQAAGDAATGRHARCLLLQCCFVECNFTLKVLQAVKPCTKVAAVPACERYVCVHARVCVRACVCTRVCWSMVTVCAIMQVHSAQHTHT